MDIRQKWVKIAIFDTNTVCFTIYGLHSMVYTLWFTVLLGFYDKQSIQDNFFTCKKNV